MNKITNNRERAKLLLADLEAELEILEEEEMNSSKAGYGGTVPNFPTGYLFAGGTGGFFHDNSNGNCNPNNGSSDWAGHGTEKALIN